VNIKLAIVFLLSTFSYSIVPNVNAEEIKQRVEIKVLTVVTMARLCPHPNCGQDQHITRIPAGTVLVIEGINTVKSGLMTVQWFEVTYKDNRGWVSILNTNAE